MTLELPGHVCFPLPLPCPLPPPPKRPPCVLQQAARVPDLRGQELPPGCTQGGGVVPLTELEPAVHLPPSAGEGGVKEGLVAMVVPAKGPV